MPKKQYGSNVVRERQASVGKTRRVQRHDMLTLACPTMGHAVRIVYGCQIVQLNVITFDITKLIQYYPKLIKNITNIMW